MLTVTAPDGGLTKKFYDADDRLVATTDAVGNTTRYDYDRRGNLVTLLDAAGQKTRYAYDGKQRTAATYSDGEKRKYVRS